MASNLLAMIVPRNQKYKLCDTLLGYHYVMLYCESLLFGTLSCERA